MTDDAQTTRPFRHAAHQHAASGQLSGRAEELGEAAGRDALPLLRGRHARHHRRCRLWQAGRTGAAPPAKSRPPISPAGVDPNARRSSTRASVPAHAELAWIFNCVARLGWMDRMTQFKEKSGKHKERASVGLYTYPVLMAADILVYKATHVPVGEDQKQHLELSRDIAQKFNNDFGAPDFFPLPEPVITGTGDAGDEPARRRQEDVQVRRERLFAHQSDRRCRRHRPEDPQGQDRSRAPARLARKGWRAARKRRISSTSMPRWPTRTATR